MLFSAHMAQHQLLMLVAAPLLVLGELPLAALWALPRGWAKALARPLQALARAWRGLTQPAAAWLLFTGVTGAWHLPTLFQAALRSATIHALEHSCFLGVSLLFWGALFQQTALGGGRSAVASGRSAVAVPYLFFTILQSGIFGALITFASQPWYDYYAPLTAAWGLSALEDQQLAGLIMWVPGGMLYTLLAVGSFAAWLHAMEQRSQPAPEPYPVERA